MRFPPNPPSFVKVRCKIQAFEKAENFTLSKMQVLLSPLNCHLHPLKVCFRKAENLSPWKKKGWQDQEGKQDIKILAARKVPEMSASNKKRHDQWRRKGESKKLLFITMYFFTHRVLSLNARPDPLCSLHASEKWLLMVHFGPIPSRELKAAQLSSC